MKTQTARQADAEAIKLAYGRTTTEEQLAKHNKAQHSPLPWRIKFVTPTVYGGNIEHKYGGQVAMVTAGENDQLANAKLIVRAVNHADKLAEALRRTMARLEYAHGKVAFDTNHHKALNQASEALAAYEEAKGK